MRRALLVVAMVAIAGCLDRTAAVCSDGRVCAPGTVCVPSLDLCVEPDRVTACDGLAENAACSSDSAPMGVCTGGVCTQAGCGNAVVEAGEQCDDGNTVSGDGCSADCLSTELCGNGVVDEALGEECDCGGTPELANPSCNGELNGQSAGRCRLDCKAHCGDGLVNSVEQCDPGTDELVSCTNLADGFDRGLTPCSSSCTPMGGDGCGYFGWRTRGLDSPVTVSNVPDLIFTGPGSGFGVSDLGTGGAAAPFENYGVDIADAYTAAVLLNAVWAPDDTMAVVVGDNGTIVHWNGTGWTEQVSPTTENLRDVWGRSANEIYAVGDGGTMLAWDGVSWSSLTTSPTSAALHSIAGDADNLYIVGDGGSFYHDAGGGFVDLAPATSADLRAVWSTSEMTVAVGTGGTILELRGASLVAGSSPVSVDLLGVWGDPRAGFFVAGERGVTLFFDGAAWRPLSLGAGITGSDVQRFRSVTGLVWQEDPSDPALSIEVGVAGDAIATFEGAAWSPTASGTASTLLGLWGASADDVFAVGRNGTILHHDGVDWTPQASGTLLDLNAVYGTAADAVVAVGEGGIALHYDGVSWNPVATGTTADLYGVWASAADNVYAVGDDVILRFDGTAWTGVSLPPKPPPPGEPQPPDPPPAVPINYRGIWGSSATNVWAIGRGGSYRWNGNVWTFSGTVAGTAITGRADQIYFTDDTELKRFDSSGGGVETLAELDTPGSALAYSAAAGMLVAGADGSLYRWSNGVIERLRSRRIADLTALRVVDDLIFVAGVEGTLDLLVYGW